MIFRNRITRLFLVAVLTVSLAVTPVFALGETTQEQTGSDVTKNSEQTDNNIDKNTEELPNSNPDNPGEIENPTTTEPENLVEDDSEDQEQTVSAFASTSTNKSWRFFQSYSSTPSIITCSGGKLRGIDISVWQGNINWAKVAADKNKGNLDFVIIRCSHSSSILDSKFKQNVAACEKYNIPYGVYLYSTATTTSAARKEAATAMNLLKGHYPDLPVYYDLEASSILKKTKSRSTITSFAKAFCSTLDNNGYRAGVYANLNWFDKYIDGYALKNQGYDLWLAQWPKSSKSYSDLGHKDKYNVWQVCSYGNYDPTGRFASKIDKVSGISGRIDLNLMMKSKAEMDAFMTYNSLPSTLAISSRPYTTAYVLKSDEGRKGPGLGYKEFTENHTEGNTFEVTGTANGYIGLADGSWVSSSSVVDINSPKEFVDEGIETEPKLVLKSYAGETITSNWATVKGKLYYVNEEGVALTGMQTLNEKQYYFGTDGVIRSNQLARIDGTTYYLGAKGIITKNAFVRTGLYTYGFDENGAMMKNCSLWIKYSRYKLDGNGRAYILKAKTKKTAYYYSKPGSGKKGKLKKRKSFYVIAKSGSWSQMANGYWIRTSYTTKTAVYPTKKPAEDVQYKAKLTKKTRSYTGPSSGYIKQRYFYKNKKVTVIGTYGSWAKVSSGHWLPQYRLKKY